MILPHDLLEIKQLVAAGLVLQQGDFDKSLEKLKADADAYFAKQKSDLDALSARVSEECDVLMKQADATAEEAAGRLAAAVQKEKDAKEAQIAARSAEESATARIKTLEQKEAELLDATNKARTVEAAKEKDLAARETALHKLEIEVAKEKKQLQDKVRAVQAAVRAP